MNPCRSTAIAGVVAILSVSAVVTSCSSSGSVTSRSAPDSGNLGAVKTLALIDARGVGTQYAADDLSESSADRMARQLVLDLSRSDAFQVVDARRPGFHREVGKDPARTAALVQNVPADAYLSLEVFDCTCRTLRESQRRGTGSDTGETTLYVQRGECEAELTARDREGRSLASVRRKGRWDGPPLQAGDQRQAFELARSNAVDEVSRQLAAGLREARRK